MSMRRRFLSVSPAVHALAAALVATSVIHLALVPDHLREGPVLGVLFLLAGIAGLALVPATYLNVARSRTASAALLVALIAGYVGTRVVGYEDWDATGMWTKLVELCGLAALWVSTQQPNGERRVNTWAPANRRAS